MPLLTTRVALAFFKNNTLGNLIKIQEEIFQSREINELAYFQACTSNVKRVVCNAIPLPPYRSFRLYQIQLHSQPSQFKIAAYAEFAFDLVVGVLYGFGADGE